MNRKKVRRLAAGMLICGVNGSACANIPIDGVLSPKGTDAAFAKAELDPKVDNGTRNQAGLVNTSVELKAAIESLFKLKTELTGMATAFDKSMKAATEQANKVQAGRDGWNIAPVLNVMGSGGLACFLGILVLVVGLFGNRWIKLRRALAIMIRTVELLPDDRAAEMKSVISKAALTAGVAQQLHSHVQGVCKQILKERKTTIKPVSVSVPSINKAD